MLLWGIAFELAFAGVITYIPLFQHIFRTAAVSVDALLLMLPFPFIVWGPTRSDAGSCAAAPAARVWDPDAMPLVDPELDAFVDEVRARTRRPRHGHGSSRSTSIPTATCSPRCGR